MTTLPPPWNRFLEELPVAILTSDPEDRVLWANEAAGRLFGVGAGALEGRDWRRLISPNPDERGVRERSDPAGTPPGTETPPPGPVPEEVAGLVVRPDGSEVRVRLTRSPSGDATLVCLRESSSTEAALPGAAAASDGNTISQVPAAEGVGPRAGLDWWDAAPVGLALIDAGGVVRRVNPALEAIYRAQPGALSGSPLEEFVSDDSRSDLEVRLEQARLEDTQPAGEIPATTTELVGLRRDGHPFWLELTLGRRAPSGETPVIFVDVTGRRRDTERRQIEREQAKHAQHLKAVSNLAAGFAHDFNNILATVLASAELALEVVDEPDAAGDLRLVVQAAHRGKRLVEKVLEYSRRDVFERSSVTIHGMVHEALPALRASLPAGIALTLGPLGFERIHADPAAIQQLLDHLIAQAVRSMPHGGEIRIAARPTGAEGPAAPDAGGGSDEVPYRRLELTVRDTGSSTPVPELDRGPREPRNIPRPQPRDALGLAVALSIVEEHDGTLEIQRVAGEGTTVRCYFPLLDESDEPVRI